MKFAEYSSPVGKLLLRSDGTALTGLWFQEDAELHLEEDAILSEAKQWLDGYFRGENRPVGFVRNPQGTAFQRLVWRLLEDIPCGETRTYGDLARQAAAAMGKEKMSAQAIGQAVGSNPISILIPCHRVVGARGQLTGYAWGLEKKKWLLSHEAREEENDHQ